MKVLSQEPMEPIEPRMRPTNLVLLKLAPLMRWNTQMKSVLKKTLM